MTPAHVAHDRSCSRPATGGRLAALLTVGATRVTEFVVQLVDRAGNVAASTNKGPGYVALPAVVGQFGLDDRRHTAPGPSGYRAVPSPQLSNGVPTGQSATVTVDGGQPFTYAGPVRRRR